MKWRTVDDREVKCFVDDEGETHWLPASRRTRRLLLVDETGYTLVIKVTKNTVTLVHPPEMKRPVIKLGGGRTVVDTLAEPAPVCRTEKYELSDAAPRLKRLGVWYNVFGA